MTDVILNCYGYKEVFNFVDMQTELFEIELFDHLTVRKQKQYLNKWLCANQKQYLCSIELFDHFTVNLY